MNEDRQVYSDPDAVTHKLRMCGAIIEGMVITLRRDHVGIKMWGMVDYLCHHSGRAFRWVWGAQK